MTPNSICSVFFVLSFCFSVCFTFILFYFIQINDPILFLPGDSITFDSFVVIASSTKSRQMKIDCYEKCEIAMEKDEIKTHNEDSNRNNNLPKKRVCGCLHVCGLLKFCSRERKKGLQRTLLFSSPHGGVVPFYLSTVLFSFILSFLWAHISCVHVCLFHFQLQFSIKTYVSVVIVFLPFGLVLIAK